MQKFADLACQLLPTIITSPLPSRVENVQSISFPSVSEEYYAALGSPESRSILFDSKGRLKLSATAIKLLKSSAANQQLVSKLFAQAATAMATTMASSAVSSESSSGFQPPSRFVSTKWRYEELAETLWKTYFEGKGLEDSLNLTSKEVAQIFNIKWQHGEKAATETELNEIFVTHLLNMKSKSTNLAAGFTLSEELVRQWLFSGYDRVAKDFHNYLSLKVNDMVEFELQRLYWMGLFNSKCQRFLPIEAVDQLQSLKNMKDLDSWEENLLLHVLPTLTEWNKGRTYLSLVSENHDMRTTTFHKALCRKLVLIDAALKTTSSANEHDHFHKVQQMAMTAVNKYRTREALSSDEQTIIDILNINPSDPKYLHDIIKAYTVYLQRLVEPHTKNVESVIQTDYFQSRWKAIFRGPKKDFVNSKTISVDLQELVRSFTGRAIDFHDGKEPAFDQGNLENMKRYWESDPIVQKLFNFLLEQVKSTGHPVTASQFLNAIVDSAKERVQYGSKVINFLMMKMASLRISECIQERQSKNQPVQECEAILQEFEDASKKYAFQPINI